MREATEIARLRLFLKMVAVVDVDEMADNLGLDPLPDIDFNIRCGNTLVGFANPQGVKDAILPPGEFQLYTEAYDKVEAKAADISDLYERFKSLQQTAEGSPEFYDAKKKLNAKLAVLNDELDRAMAQRQYSINPDTLRGNKEFEEWKRKTQPFHWYSEFYGITVANGGFDVIIGNPPYVEYSKVKDYKIFGYTTEDCGDLYAFVMERSLLLSQINARLGMIVPVSIESTDGFRSLRVLMREEAAKVWNSSYSIRPSKLFEGVEKRVTISIAVKGETVNHDQYVTKYHAWNAVERQALFEVLTYVMLPVHEYISQPKLHNAYALSILDKIFKDQSIEMAYSSVGKYPVYHTRKFRYFVQFLDVPPKIVDANGQPQVTSELKEITFDTNELRYVALAVYQSNLFSWFVFVFSDCRNLNRREVAQFPFNLLGCSNLDLQELAKKGRDIVKNLQKHSSLVEMNFAKLGTMNVQVFQPRESKPIIDEIDELLAKHYGFTEEELDFIINYDIKYRMGDKLKDAE